MLDVLTVTIIENTICRLHFVIYSIQSNIPLTDNEAQGFYDILRDICYQLEQILPAKQTEKTGGCENGK